MEAPSDGKLLVAWCGGDAGAFEALIERHQSALLRYAGALCGHGRGAQDVVQEALLRLMQRPPTLDPQAVGDPERERAILLSWLFKTTKRIHMDATRSQTRRSRREEAVGRTEAVAGGMERVEADDTRLAVERSLERLPDDQREALSLRLFGELGYKEIADVMGKKIGTVGWLISVGMKSLQTELAPLIGLESAAPAGARAGSQQKLQGGLS